MRLKQTKVKITDDKMTMCVFTTDISQISSNWQFFDIENNFEDFYICKYYYL